MLPSTGGPVLALSSTMMRLCVAGRRELVEVLDLLALIDDDDARSILHLRDRPTKMMLSVDLARILYVTRTGALFFQSPAPIGLEAVL